MRIGYFPETVGRQAGGPETYERRLFRALLAAAPDDELIAYCLSEAGADALGELPRHAHRRVLRPANRLLSLAFSLPVALARDDVDLLHATFVPPPYSTRPYVFTMHDVSMFEHPEFYPPLIRLRLNTLIRRGLRRAEIVLCVSAHTRDTVAERFGVPESRLAVAHHGVSEQYRPMDPMEARAHVAKELGIDRPYVLFVGKYERRKNLTNLIHAFARFQEAVGDDCLLVLAGKRGWAREEVETATARFGVGASLVEPGYVADADLPALYSGAAMFAFPSFWEGFGLPILEAMACGAPTITSNATCLPEVAGDAALLVDPHAPEDIAEAMVRLYEDRALADDLREKGLARASEFTWDACARATLAAYRRALAQRH